ncbi:hypothetical protein [Paenibacillus sp. RC84]|uniref:hypothetical protein n=1 Tax=Paenibacillus sp. RC84 TaxID=3156252 RepID=UPI0035139358
MAEEYRFFGSSEGDIREYNQNEFAEVFERFFTNGIFPSVDQELKVVETDPQRLAIRVSGGQAWIKGYWYKNEGYKEIDLPPADPNYPRIHRIVLRLDTIDKRRIIATLKAGTAQANPNPPQLEQNDQFWELSLATVYVGPGVTKVLTNDITDDRYCDDHCGRAVSHEYDELLDLIKRVDLTADKVKLTSPNFASTNVRDGMNELFQGVVSGKGKVAAAITDKGVSAAGSDTFQQLADKIRQIQQATGNATAADVLAGKTFSANGIVGATGTMPNRGTPTFLPGTTDQVIAPGYYPNGVVKGDPNLLAQNIMQGKSIFNVVGTAGAKASKGSLWVNASSFTISGLSFTPTIILAYTYISNIQYALIYCPTFNLNGIYNIPNYDTKISTVGPGTFTVTGAYYSSTTTWWWYAIGGDIAAV